MQVNIDSFTKNVSSQGLYSISLPDSFSLSKTVEEEEGENQKIDEAGQLIFLTPEGEETTDAEGNEPVMVPKLVQKSVSFQENPYIFNENEIAQRKFELIATELGFTYAYADEFLTEEDLDVFAVGHSANTGVKVFVLLPNGQCQTKVLSIEEAASDFTLYLEAEYGINAELNGVPFVNNRVTLEAAVNEVILTFKNTTNVNAEVYAYALLYNGGN